MFIGIDPGNASGAIAYIVPNKAVAVIKMPDSLLTVHEVLASLLTFPYEHYAVLEHVSSSPRMGVSSSFKFGMNYGQLAMFLTDNFPHDRLTHVRPQKWQTALNCLTGGDKKISLARANDLFKDVPGLNQQTADALLLAYYCYMVNK